MPLITLNDKGLFCAKANVYIDPWRPVDKALITHGHSDHARGGHKSYLCHNLSVNILKHRLGKSKNIQGIEYNKILKINDVEITFFPAGHIIGSAQIRIKDKKECWVISGDYNTMSQSLIANFEPVKCDYFITESTFGLPVFQWSETKIVMNDIHNWWIENQEKNRPSIITAYSLGKSQRIIQNLDHSIGPVLTHKTVEAHNEVIRESGVNLKATQLFEEASKEQIKNAIIVCTPGAANSSWADKIKDHSLAFASGWMAIRGARRRRNVEKGFILSDHADWKGLNETIKQTEAKKVFVTHGYTDIFTKWLNSIGVEAAVLKTAFEGENLESNN